MGFFDDIPTKARHSRTQAGRVLDLTLKASCTEYSSFEAHCESIMPPFARAWQFIRNAARILYSSYVYISTFFSSECVDSGRTSALSNIGLLIHASFLEIFNIACSIISIATRTLASLCHEGYTPGTPDVFNVSTPCQPNSLTPEQQDTAIHLQAFTFI
mgnify:CR=1 FL=1|tara:strand:- start:204 stop:680 length:477 start_codon:yes stop_codon:yes gene_type:complete